MKKRLVAPVLLAFLVFVACSSSTSPGVVAGAGPTLLGDYRAISPGSIASLTFADSTHYSMAPAGCGAASCSQSGTYTTSDGKLSLTDTATGKTTVLPFQVTKTLAQPSAERLSLLGTDLGGDDAGDGGADAGGTSLVGDAAALTGPGTSDGGVGVYWTGIDGGQTFLTEPGTTQLVSDFTANLQSFQGGASLSPAITSYFWTPTAAGQGPVIDGINAAKKTIDMFMYHLTQMPVVNALTAAAGRGVKVRLILDAGNLMSSTPAAVTKALAAAKVSVTPSSSAFSITHAKAFVVDKKTAFIMNLNMTSPYPTTRDYAVATTNPTVISDFEKVFAADLTNAKAGTKTTPALKSPYLLWSPVNSESTLVSFINEAKSTLDATAENLGDPAVQAAFIAAAKRGVTVRLISPMCDQNANPQYDIPFLNAMIAGGVQARGMPAPSTATDPYMHAKMMIADGARGYVGSMNYSTNSLNEAREVGIIFSDSAALGAFEPIFEGDWANAQVPPASASDVSCPSTTGG